MRKEILKKYIKATTYIANQEKRDMDKTLSYLDELIKEKNESQNSCKKKTL